MDALTKLRKLVAEVRVWQEPDADDPDEPGEYYRLAAEFADAVDEFGSYNVQLAPFPKPLADLLKYYRYRPGWFFELRHIDRGQNCSGLTLIITVSTVDSYHIDRRINVAHYMIVPAAAYDERSWRHWLFEQCQLVDRHEGMEFFRFVWPGVYAYEEHPYAPSHGPGNDPYMLREVGTEADQQTSFRGELKE